MQETNKYNTSCRVHSQEVIINHVAHSITWSKQDCPYCEIDRLTAQLAERDKLIEDQQAEIADCNKFNFELQQANATLSAEVERRKEESSHLWVRIESGEAAAYEQGKAEARKQAAQEIIEDVIGDWNCDCGYGGLVIADAIKAKFGLEG